MMRAFVGSYADGPAAGPGGIDVLEVSEHGTRLSLVSHADEPRQAGYLVFSPQTSTLYAVDERKTDGRGATEPAAVHALAVDPATGALSHRSRITTPAPFPTYLSVSGSAGLLFSANHGSFDHVERLVQTAAGWQVDYVYDDSAVVAYRLGGDGSILGISDVRVFREGGQDPNRFLQAGGHGQAGGHAHCATIDPSGRYVVVCDKSTELVTVLTMSEQLAEVSRFSFPAETGPRHIAFDPNSDRAYLTCEFGSAVASLSFEEQAGTFTLLDRVASTADGFDGPNEPADIRVHPTGRWIYANNRGEDSLAWFSVDDSGRLRREGHVPLAPSLHPGLAARSFAIDPTGSFLLAADRPANLIRSYAIDHSAGTLSPQAELRMPDPAYIEIVEVTA